MRPFPDEREWEPKDGEVEWRGQPVVVNTYTKAGPAGEEVTHDGQRAVANAHIRDGDKVWRRKLSPSSRLSERDTGAGQG